MCFKCPARCQTQLLQNFKIKIHTYFTDNDNYIQNTELLADLTSTICSDNGE